MVSNLFSYNLREYKKLRTTNEKVYNFVRCTLIPHINVLVWLLLLLGNSQSRI